MIIITKICNLLRIMKYSNLIFLILFAPLLQGDFMKLQIMDTTSDQTFYIFGTFYGHCTTCSKWDGDTLNRTIFQAGYSAIGSGGRQIFVYTFGPGYISQDGIPVFSVPFRIPIDIWTEYNVNNCIEFTIIEGKIISPSNDVLILPYNGDTYIGLICIQPRSSLYIPVIIK